MSLRRVSDKPLHVVDGLVGAPLASPVRRAVAIALDTVLIMVPSVAVAAAAAWMTLAYSDPRALDGVRALLRRSHLDEAGRREAVKSVLPLLAKHEAPGLPPAARAAVEEARLDEAFEIVRDYAFQFNLQIGEFGTPPLPPRTIRIEVGELIPKSVRFLALYGVAAAYFTLLSSSRRGQTLGKRLAGIRVARLDGERLALAESLERFVGYLHIPAMAGIPLLDLWRDPNRRMPHDRTVHTVVLRVTGRIADAPAGERTLASGAAAHDDQAGVVA